MHFQRLYIDSRDRVSGTATDFTYQLPTNITVPEESIAVLDTVLIPVSWYTVQKDYNDRIYIAEYHPASLESYRIVTIEQGYCDIKALAMAVEKPLPVKTDKAAGERLNSSE